MKYLLYRALGEHIERDVKKHELIAVEYGKDIYEVGDALIKDVVDDLGGLPEYEKCEVAAYAPELRPTDGKARRYRYEMTGIICPPNAKKNIIIGFGIVEEKE